MALVRITWFPEMNFVRLQVTGCIMVLYRFGPRTACASLFLRLACANRGLSYVLDVRRGRAFAQCFATVWEAKVRTGTGRCRSAPDP